MPLFGSEFNYIIELQDQLSQIDDGQIPLDFPHIAVIGSQSSGKSSVLERIVGEDFIPRGPDTVTRRPLYLHLKNSESNHKKYGVFSHRPNDSFEDFTQIHDEIESQTKELIKGNKFSKTPITLTLYGPDLVDLTLIDLPGITLISSEEDNNNVEEITKDICMEYIQRKNCLILAVSGANQDIQNSPAIQLARKADKEGDRTIGVLTKLDIMDAGTHAKKLLTRKHNIKLKHGFIGIINRSQKNINDKVSISDSLEQELMFFKNSEIYHDIASKNGITYLKQFLHDVLKEHLGKTLPKYLKGILDKYQELKDDIDSLPSPQNEDEQMVELCDVLRQFDTEFKREIGGSLMTYQDDHKTRGINIRQIMHDNYGKTIDSLTYNEEEMVNHIKSAENNTYGYQCYYDPSDVPLRSCIEKQLKRYVDPSLNCVDLVHNELSLTIKECLNRNQRFPNINNLFSRYTLSFLREANKKCRSYIGHFIEEEKFINKLNEYSTDFNNIKNDVGPTLNYGIKRSLNQVIPNSGDIIEGGIGLVNAAKDALSDGQSADGQVMAVKKRVDGHIAIIKQTFKDRIPKICSLELIDRTTVYISQQLVPEIQKNHKTMDKIIGVDRNQEKRKKLEVKLEQYENVIKVIEKIYPDLVAFNVPSNINIDNYDSHGLAASKNSSEADVNGYYDDNRDNGEKVSSNMARAYSALSDTNSIFNGDDDISDNGD